MNGALTMIVEDLWWLEAHRPSEHAPLAAWFQDILGADYFRTRAVTLGEGHVEIEVFRLDRDGRPFVDPEDPKRAATEHLTLPAPTPPPCWYPGIGRPL